MAKGMYGRIGIARLYSLIFGIAYLAVAAIEVLFQGRFSEDFGIEFTGLQNAIHWTIGVIALAVFFATERTARIVARVIGIAFLILTIWGFAKPLSFGDFLGYPGDVPQTYNVVHLLTALAALFAGFTSRDRPEVPDQTETPAEVAS